MSRARWLPRTSPAPVVVAWRLYSTATDDVVPNKRKVWDSVDEAIKDIKSGDVLLSGGASSLASTISGEQELI